MKSIIILILLPIFLYAQEYNFVFEPDSIPLEINGWQIFSTWGGGES